MMAGSNAACWGLSQFKKAGYKYPSPDGLVRLSGAVWSVWKSL